MQGAPGLAWEAGQSFQENSRVDLLLWGCLFRRALWTGPVAFFRRQVEGRGEGWERRSSRQHWLHTHCGNVVPDSVSISASQESRKRWRKMQLQSREASVADLIGSLVKERFELETFAWVHFIKKDHKAEETSWGLLKLCGSNLWKRKSHQTLIFNKWIWNLDSFCWWKFRSFAKKNLIE